MKQEQEELFPELEAGEVCPRCAEPVSDFTPCGCSFVPHDPHYSQRARFAPGAMRAMSHRRWGKR